MPKWLCPFHPAYRVQKPGIKGALVADRHGLALALHGTAPEGAAGPAKLLVDRAKQLGEGQACAVCITTDSGSVLVEEQSALTVVLYRE